jgi:hypothetical protein
MKRLFAELNWKFGLIAAAMAWAIAMAAQSVAMKQATAALDMRLAQKAAFINKFYSFLIADALQRKDDVTLLQVIHSLEEDQEVVSVVVVDDIGEIRYHVDPEKMSTVTEEVGVKKALETGDGVMEPTQNEGGKALLLVSPLKVQSKEKPIGAVRIEFTYRDIANQISRFRGSFLLSTLGLIAMAVGLLAIFVRRWVSYPLERLTKWIARANPLTAEAGLPETSDEFGQLNKALNEFIVRFRAELQNQQIDTSVQSEREGRLLETVVRSLFPAHRILLIDNENRILTDTKPAEGAGKQHLLDIATDAQFTSLISAAFQKEGEVVQGSVTFQDQPYVAAVLRIPEALSTTVKTLIALRPVNAGEQAA